MPVVLGTILSNAEQEGYAEGVVTNTRFGSFPHSTLIDVPWGSQVRASQVDTGSRGRMDNKKSKKRKADAMDGTTGANGVDSPSAQKDAVTASSGFIHVLPPTPENWTTSLPHRTQVVYTPDYSYILHRLRVRPGSTMIEAGSGSGSFTHAAARAVFNGRDYRVSSDTTDGEVEGLNWNGDTRQGRIFTYEFHAGRHEKLQAEMAAHGLTSIVSATHRDVCRDGFMVKGPGENGLYNPPAANAVFLDLPAPWDALPHLTRHAELGLHILDASSTVHICTFSPCIEQAQRTISALRRYGWLDIEMVEMQHKRIEIRREYTGLKYDGMRGVNAAAVDVDEAISKLREVEQWAKDFHSKDGPTTDQTKATKAQNRQQDAAKALFTEGELVHRTEPEIKTHTSYLVFAILPRVWNEEDEETAREQWGGKVAVDPNGPKSQRQLKKEAKRKAKAQDEAKAMARQAS